MVGAGFVAGRWRSPFLSLGEDGAQASDPSGEVVGPMVLPANKKDVETLDGMEATAY